MKRTLPTIITFFAVTAARASDLLTTFHFNPSLSHEANPIVPRFGADASTLLLTNLLGVIIFLLVPLFIYWRFPAAPLQSIPTNLREFACLQLYGRILSPSELCRAVFLFVPLPKNGLQALRFMGFALSWTVVFGSFLAVFSWWAIWGWHWHSYQQFFGTFAIANYPVMLALLCLVFFFVASVGYFRMEFSAFRNDRNG